MPISQRPAPAARRPFPSGARQALCAAGRCWSVQPAARPWLPRAGVGPKADALRRGLIGLAWSEDLDHHSDHLLCWLRSKAVLIW